MDSHKDMNVNKFRSPTIKHFFKKEKVKLLTCLSLCNTQARAVNLIHAVLCDDEGVTQVRGCYRHETGRRVER